MNHKPKYNEANMKSGRSNFSLISLMNENGGQVFNLIDGLGSDINSWGWNGQRLQAKSASNVTFENTTHLMQSGKGTIIFRMKFGESTIRYPTSKLNGTIEGWTLRNNSTTQLRLYIYNSSVLSFFDFTVADVREMHTYAIVFNGTSIEFYQDLDQQSWVAAVEVGANSEKLKLDGTISDVGSGEFEFLYYSDKVLLQNTVREIIKNPYSLFYSKIDKLINFIYEGGSIVANPIPVTCEIDVWTKVATNVTAGQVKKLSKRPNMYLETYRMTDDSIPTGRSEAVPMFENSNSETISASAGIDIYVMAVGAEGKVRVDLP